MVVRQIACCLAIVAAGAALARQNPATLADYLAAHPWKGGAEGALVVVWGTDGRAYRHADGLAGFGRKLARVGTVSAIVPEEMVILDANLNNSPNLYYGLSEGDKVKYLMSTLTEEQWKTATSGGIGLGDLDRNQALVFKSILPKAFAWQVQEVNVDTDFRSLIDKENAITLPADQMSQVKIYIFRTVDVQGPSLSNPNSTEGVEARYSKHHPLAVQKLLRNDNIFNSEFSRYGETFRKTLANEPKPSDLNYRAPKLLQTIGLPATTNVRNLLVQVSQKTGLNLKADVRVADKPVTIVGASSTCGDLLKAMCLALTGTFRKVGAVYLLTSDLEGIGTRQSKIEFWLDSVDGVVNKRRGQWNEVIGRSKGLAEVRYDPSDALAPNDKMSNWLASPKPPEGLPLTALSPAWQKLLTQNRDKVASENLTLHESLDWQFMLPTGEKLEYTKGEGMSDFLPRTPAAVPETPTRSKMPSGNRLAVCLRAMKPEDAIAAVSRAAHFGFSELWLQTESRPALEAALQAGKAAGVKVRFYVRPFEALTGGVELDRTMAGDTSGAAVEQFAESSLAEKFAGWLGPVTGFTNLLSPLDTDLSSRWVHLAELANLPGVATVLAGTLPRGYEPTVGSDMNPDHVTTEFQDLGYTESARLQMVSSYPMDPIDFPADPLPGSRYDLSVPTFSDSETRPGIAFWRQFLSSTNEGDILELTSHLKGPLLIEIRRTVREFLTGDLISLAAWQSGQPLPTVGSDLIVPDTTTGFGLIRLAERMSPTAELAVWRHFSGAAKDKTPLAVDLTEIVLAHVDSVLNGWIAP